MGRNQALSLPCRAGPCRTEETQYLRPTIPISLPVIVLRIRSTRAHGLALWPPPRYNINTDAGPLFFDMGAVGAAGLVFTRMQAASRPCYTHAVPRIPPYGLRPALFLRVMACTAGRSRTPGALDGSAGIIAKKVMQSLHGHGTIRAPERPSRATSGIYRLA